MIPAAFRSRLVRKEPAELTLTVSRQEFSLRQTDGEDTAHLPQEDVASLAAAIIANSQSGRVRIEIILEPGRYLERQLTPFRLPRRRARDMAALDIESSTPLDPAGVVPLFPRDDPDWPAQRYFIVKKPVLTELLVAIEGAARVSSIKMRTAGGDIEIGSDDYRQFARQRRRGTAVVRLAKAGALACAFAAIVTLAHAQWRYTDASRALDKTIERLDADVKVVRTLSDQRKRQLRQIENVRLQKQQAVPLVLVWEELTRVVPDDAWVTDLSVNGNRVTFTGLSASAAGLIAMLEASPLLRGPTFTSPVMKSPDAKGERFTVEMEIER
jgi:general secretion pathway protein L